MKAFIVNDTHKLGQHFGCELVMDTYQQQLDRVDIELVGTQTHREELCVPDNVDLVIVNGEGTVHHGNNYHLVEIGKQYPAVFLNAVWQDNPTEWATEMSHYKYVSVRESRSSKQLPQADVVPDIIFSNEYLLTRGAIKGANTFVSDNVLNCDAGLRADVSSKEYTQRLLSHSNAVCGRYHTAVLCCVLGIPFSAWPSNTHKIAGLMADAGVPELYFDNQVTAMRNVPSVLAESIREYTQSAKKKVDKQFEKLYNV